jgi:hypothetical protein
MFIAVRMNITEAQGSRACLMNTGENSLRSGLACSSDSGDIVVPKKFCLSEAERSSCRSGLTSASDGEAGWSDERWRSLAESALGAATSKTRCCGAVTDASVRVRVTLRLTVSLSWCRAPSRAHDQIFILS